MGAPPVRRARLGCAGQLTGVPGSSAVAVVRSRGRRQVRYGNEVDATATPVDCCSPRGQS